MNIRMRINKLEQRAALLPPDGEALRRVETMISLDKHEEWLRGLTDEELMALIEAAKRAGEDHGIIWELLTDEELDQMDAMTFDWDNIRPELLKGD